jgi:hypothetical protein
MPLLLQINFCNTDEAFSPPTIVYLQNFNIRTYRDWLHPETAESSHIFWKICHSEGTGCHFVSKSPITVEQPEENGSTNASPLTTTTRGTFFPNQWPETCSEGRTRFLRHHVQTASWAIQPPAQWVQGAVSPRAKRPACAKVKDAWSYTSTTRFLLHGAVLY